jgi:Lhr-like helicase
VETVIVDEIHALVPSKRGAHMALSLERLEALDGAEIAADRAVATQRPLEEVARFLGGAVGASGECNRRGHYTESRFGVGRRYVERVDEHGQRRGRRLRGGEAG